MAPLRIEEIGSSEVNKNEADRDTQLFLILI